MRPTKPDIAGAGTSALLLAGCALLFVVMGALVAFHDWSPPAPSDGPADVTVREPRSLVAAVPAPGARKPAGRSRGSRVRGQPSPSRARRAEPRAQAPSLVANGRARGQGPVTARDPRQEPRIPPPPPASAPAPSAAPAPPRPRPTAVLGPVVRGLALDLAETTEKLTHGVGQTVGGVDPVTGQVVAPTGETVSDILRLVGAR